MGKEYIYIYICVCVCVYVGEYWASCVYLSTLVC